MIASDVIFFGVEDKNTFDFDFCSFFDSRNSRKIILFFVQEDFKRTKFRLFHKLSENHVMPTSWKKMNVKLAAQLLSETVGMLFFLPIDD